MCVCERERERERLEGNPFVDRPKTKMEVLEFRLEERERERERRTKASPLIGSKKTVGSIQDLFSLVTFL